MAELEFVAGLALVLVILWDAFETIILPRTVQRRFRISVLIFRVSWQPWRGIATLPIGGNQRESLLALYGPLLLFFFLAVWGLCLILGFSLMLHALDGTSAEQAHFGDALYMSGSTFFTLGLGDVTPANSAAKVVTVFEAGAGFGFLAMVISYLPIFYQAFARREVAISLLDSRAGSPPTAIELIRRNPERVAEQLLAEWEAWSAELLESHLSHPVLALFRSQHERQSWLAALTVILDTSALLMTGLKGLPDKQARFSFAVARHTLVDLAQVYFVQPRFEHDGRLPHADFLILADRLASYGFAFEKGPEAEEALAALRRGYEPIAEALGQRILLDLPPWLPAADAMDDWQSSPWDTLAPI